MTWFSDYIYANGIRHHYTRTGGDKPPIILLHGLTDNGLYWTTIAQDLERDYDVIMPDARGHGLTDPVGANPSWKDNAEDVASLIQQFGLNKPGVIGHSMGAGTAGVFAARHPELIRYLVLEDPPLFPRSTPSETESAQDRFAVDPWEQWLIVLKSKPRIEQLAIARSEHPMWPEVELERWIDGRNQFNLSTLHAVYDSTPDWRDVLPQIQCPVLLITGDPAKGAIITPEIADEAISLLPNGRVVRIPESGHSIRFDQHDAYLKAITAFLRDHDQ